MLKSLLPTCALAALALCGCSSVHKIEPTPVRVAVAESLRPAMLDIAKAYEQTQPFVRLEIISGNALSLQRQMLKKIPADLAILDGPGLMDELIEKDVVVGKSRVSLLTNRLIIPLKQPPPDDLCRLRFG